jgi:hypothetical protein
MLMGETLNVLLSAGGFYRTTPVKPFFNGLLGSGGSRFGGKLPVAAFQ